MDFTISPEITTLAVCYNGGSGSGSWGWEDGQTQEQTQDWADWTWELTLDQQWGQTQGQTQDWAWDWIGDRPCEWPQYWTWEQTPQD